MNKYYQEDMTTWSEDNKNVQNKPSKPNNNNIHSNKIPLFKQILLFLIGWVGLTLIALLLSYIIKLFPIDTSSSSGQALYSCLVNFFAYFILIIILFIILNKEGIIHVFKDFKDWRNLVKGLIYCAIMMVATTVYSIIIQALVPGYGDNENQSSIVKMVQYNPYLTFFMICVFAPITEELTYRLGLFGACRRKSRIFGYILSLTIFGLIHTPFLDGSFVGMSQSEIINELLNLPTYMISGFVLAYAYDRENSLSVSMTAHMLNNLIGFIEILIALSRM